MRKSILQSKTTARASGRSRIDPAEWVCTLWIIARAALEVDYTLIVMREGRPLFAKSGKDNRDLGTIRCNSGQYIKGGHRHHGTAESKFKRAGHAHRAGGRSSSCARR